MKYIKKPVVVEAYNPLGEPMPEWFVEMLQNGSVRQLADGTFDIDTLEGVMHASEGDYIVRGLHGEPYPCKPDIFLETYEPVSGMEPKL